MTATRFASAILVTAIASCTPTARAPSPRLDPIRTRVTAQQHVVETFFDERMPAGYRVEVAVDRAAMQRFAAGRWHVPALPCWAVAMGTGSTLLVLDPRVWRTQACDHASDDDAAIDRVIAHELVHVFQGQHRPADPELDRAEPVGWFVEGLATYASGQLTAEREHQVAEFVASGGGPTRLADAWTGKARYAVAGTLVRSIDRRFGRARLRELLALSTTEEILARLGISEPELLATWRRDVAP